MIYFSKVSQGGIEVFKRQLKKTLFYLQKHQDFEGINLLEELQLYIENLLPEKALY